MFRCGCTLVAVFFSLCVTDLCAVTEIVLKSGNVNVMSAPSADASVVATVQAGDVLRSLSVSDGWMMIAPPASIEFWVYGELISDNKVVASSVSLRSGPGIKFQSLGTLDRGESIHPIQGRDEWIQIVRPKKCVLWVDASAVALQSSAASPEPKPVRDEPIKVPEKKTIVPKKVVPRPSVPSPKKVVSPPPAFSSKRPSSRRSVVVSTPAPPPPVKTVASPVKPSVVVPRVATAPVRRTKVAFSIDKNKLVSSVPQGQMVELRGVLRDSGLLFKRGLDYRLVGSGLGRSANLCYVAGGRDWSSLVGQDVVIKGRKYILRGVRRPVVVPSGNGIVRSFE